MKYLSIIFFVLLLLSACKNSVTVADDGIGKESGQVVTQFYSQEDGDSWHYVGNDIYKDAYRGIYWLGPSATLTSAEIELNCDGDISGISFKMTVWEVDTSDHLKLSTLLATSISIPGSSIEPNGFAGDWTTFTFPTPVTLTSGKTVILVSRINPANDDTVNHLKISNNYDTNNLDNDTSNVHYGADGILKGRGPGDEDQPEPFAVDIRLNGFLTSSATATSEYPAPPESLSYTAGSQSGIVQLNWAYRSSGVLVNMFRVYAYNETDASLTLVGTTSQKTYTVTGLTSGQDYFFVVTAVSAAGNESYHSLTPEDADFNPQAITAP